MTQINTRITSEAGRTTALALANYYLHDVGGNISTVAQVALGINIDATVAKIDSSSAQLIKVVRIILEESSLLLTVSPLAPEQKT